MAINMVKQILASAALAVAALSHAHAAEPVTYQLGWVPGGTNAIEYMAQSQGMFEAEGLDVRIVSGNGASDTLSRVAAGTADIGLVGMEALLAAAAEQPMPVKAVFALYSRKPDAIHVPADSPIQTVADLAGRKVGIGSFSSSNVVWPVFAQSQGLEPDQVQLMKVDAAAVAPMMATGQVDALINWLTVAPVDRAVMQAAGRDMRVIPWSDFGYEGYGQAIVANETVLAERPEVVRAFLRAFVKASEAAIADPAAGGAAVHALVPEVDATVAAEEFAASVPLIRNRNSERDGFGAFRPELLATTWDWVARARSLPLDRLDPADLVAPDYRPQ